MQPQSAFDPGRQIPPSTLAFYQDVLKVLNTSSLPYLVGGGYAFHYYTGIRRQTKDLDIFICRDDLQTIFLTLKQAGFATELTYPHWLGKIYLNGDFIDLVFSSGNGISEVDKTWFDYAVTAEILGMETRICPVEETIWSKAFIMERERFDGADIAHLILACGQQMDWPRLLHRFGTHWRPLLSHLILYGFIYPTRREIVPKWVMHELMDRLYAEVELPPTGKHLCMGTLLSREQYLDDIHEQNFQDARITPYGNLTDHDAAIWTKAIKDKQHQ